MKIVGKLFLGQWSSSFVCISLQEDSMDGFGWYRPGIESFYVDGLSITYGSPRQHIWTFAVGLSQTFHPQENCPCDQFPGKAPPAFVGNDYYCETGSNISDFFAGLYTENRLWDGSCFSNSTCCDRAGMPFFTKDLNVTVSDEIEIRICADQDTNDENLGLEKLELFVRWRNRAVKSLK